MEAAHIDVTLGEIASKRFIVAREDTVVFDLIDRMYRKHATMAVVTGRGSPTGDDVVGIITKEHIADSVASSVRIYAHE